ncbi:MAG: hypothetical protein AB7U83_02505 [Vicinamibacterales bacterium]
MRRIASLCALLVTVVAAPVAAQEPLPPQAFGTLGMYPKRLSCADLPVFSEPRPVHRLPAAHEGDAKLRRAFAAPDTLVLFGGTSVGLEPGQQFFVRRLLTRPDHRRPSATSPATVHTAGWITITASDDYSALARIDHACDHFLKDDYLEPFAAAPLPTALAAEGATQFTDLGRLMFGTDGRQTFANGDLIVVNRGASHGLTAGARLTIFRDPRTWGPLVEVGRAIVLTVAGDTSTVIADRVRDVLYAGDWVGTQAPPSKP